MTIEETFRDEKHILAGFALEKMRLSSAERYDRMFLIISYVYLFVVLLGLEMEQRNMHRKIMPNTVLTGSLSLFWVGLYFLNSENVIQPSLLRLTSPLIYKIQIGDNMV